ncbi:hypothetical protein L2E82_48068 [Cichorium intybus]|uniref:Uncharacterized protein n=1 Tax=Cichorium intybus TaxID=13427 RepID=A0ACB8YYA9_CICIN|nr:hypothetical protein L2E82_48068 [Cichorium intybus]
MKLFVVASLLGCLGGREEKGASILVLLPPPQKTKETGDHCFRSRTATLLLRFSFSGSSPIEAFDKFDFGFLDSDFARQPVQNLISGFKEMYYSKARNKKIKLGMNGSFEIMSQFIRWICFLKVYSHPLDCNPRDIKL